MMKPTDSVPAEITLKDVAEDLASLEINKIQIPKFYIPNWPSGVSVSGRLEKRDYRVPVLRENGFFEWKTGRHKISFQITKKGVISFKFHGFRKPSFDFKGVSDFGCDFIHRVHSVHSDNDDQKSRLAAVILFEQFKTEIFLQVLSHLKKNSETHNKLVEEVGRAFEPFIPYLVADALSDG